MNVIFRFSLLLLIAISFLSDWPALRSTKKAEQAVYWILAAAAIVLLSATAMGYRSPMPTKLLSDWMAPWAKMLLGGE